MLRVIIKNRNIVFLWIGHLISHAGDAIFAIALPWLLLEMTDSKIQTAIISTSVYLPSLIFGLFAGVIVDKYNRKSIMIFSDLMRFFLVSIIPIALIIGFASPILIGITAFFVSSFSILFYPARDCLIPQLTKPEELSSVNSAIAISGQFSHLLGPLLAGVGLSIFGLTHLFTIDAISFLASIFMISLIINSNNTNTVKKSKSQLDSLTEGINYIKKEKGLATLLLVTILNNIFIMGPAFLGLAVFVREILLEDFSILAYLEVSMASGMIVGSVIFWMVNKYCKLINILIIGIIIDGLTFCLLYIVQENFIAILVLFIHGIGIPLIMVSRTTIIQRVVPDEMRGRLFAMFHMSVVGTTAISIALTGIALEYIGSDMLFLIIGVCASLCSTIGFSTNLIRLEGRAN